jgi:hypothetical protein
MGLLASLLFDYKSIFLLPIISDYYKPINSIAAYLGPAVQILRGVLFGLVLLPLRNFIKENKYSWLWLWLLIIVLGIINTPAASPSSIEGVVYSKIPTWFHFFGLPEIVVQTLLFSVLVQRKLRAEEHPLPEIMKKSLNALVSACISFVGYTVVSIIFALSVGSGIDSTNASIRIIGQFIAPLFIIFIFALLKKPGNEILRHIIMYALSVLVIAAYQQFILGSAGALYVFIAPILPICISFFVGKCILKKV